MNITITDFNDIAFWAFRYALGRKTYAVGNIVDILIRHSEFINLCEKSKMISEIDRAIKEGRAGADCDMEDWNKLKIALQNINEQQSTEVEE